MDDAVKSLLCGIGANHLKATWKMDVLINTLADHMATTQEQCRGGWR